MDSIFFVKKVGEKISIRNSRGENIDKLSVVLTTKECRSGDSGVYAADVDFAVDLLGERAASFSVGEGEWLVGTLSFSTREYNGGYFQDVRLNRYVKL